jgi:uncharacterized repeat protein (TIGR03806 family)
MKKKENVKGPFSGALFCVLFAFCVVANSVAGSSGSYLGMTGRLQGTGGWRVVPAYGSIWMNELVGFVPESGTRRILAYGRDGKILAFEDRQDVAWGDGGLVNMILHPGYADTNSPGYGSFFLWYNYVDNWGPSLPIDTLTKVRLSRFRTTPGAVAVDPSTEEVLIEQEDQHIYHSGGGMFFHPGDGFLYISVSDEGGAWDAYSSTQQITENFFSGVLRIDVDKRGGQISGPIVNQPKRGRTAGYYIPKDNPWVDVPDALHEFYAVGLRNPHRMTYDALDDVAWIADAGESWAEEINKLKKGANYQWPFYEGPYPGVRPRPSTLWGEETPPFFSYGRSVGDATIGGHVYRGSQWAGRLGGKYVFGDFRGNIYALDYKDRLAPALESVAFVSGGRSIASVSLDHAGEPYFCNFSTGRILRLESDFADAERVPDLLSETGLFTSLQPLVPRQGLTPYEVNTPFWSDYMIKRRWFILPGTNTIGFRIDQPWSFPVGTVWVKHFDRPTVRPASQLVPTETRVLVMTPDGVVGVSYRWNAAGTDAVLVAEEGDSATYDVSTDESVQVRQAWRFPSRSECQACHTAAAGGPLAFNTAQLNKAVNSGGSLLSQLDLMAGSGCFSSPPTNTAIMPALVSIDDENASLERRVRSYLEANCAQCHRPGGPTRMQWDARIGTPLDDMGVVGVPERAPIGTNVLSLIDPGNLAGSALFQRISTLGAIHMPPLGTSELDHAAISLVSRWITNDLPTRPRFSTWAVNWLVGVPAEQAVRSADPDGDGLDNYTEYLLRENPKSPVKWWKPRITADAGGHTMRFPRLSGRRFEVEWSDRLGATAQWQRLERIENDPRLVAADGEAIIPLPEADVRFYRVKVSEQ